MQIQSAVIDSAENIDDPSALLLYVRRAVG
jgi:hypothetical protein